MTYSVAISSEARRSISRLPTKVAMAVVEFITGPLCENPLRLSKPLRGELDGLRSARRGDYRVLIEVDEASHALLVVRVGHRADVYRSP